VAATDGLNRNAGRQSDADLAGAPVTSVDESGIPTHMSAVFDDQTFAASFDASGLPVDPSVASEDVREAA